MDSISAIKIASVSNDEVIWRIDEVVGGDIKNLLTITKLKILAKSKKSIWLSPKS